MEQVWHANGLMAQWHSPPYVRFSSRGQIPLFIREKRRSFASIRLEVGPWCNGSECLPPKLTSPMFKSRISISPKKRKNVGKPAYQSPHTTHKVGVLCSRYDLVINKCHPTHFCHILLFNGISKLSWCYSSC